MRVVLTWLREVLIAHPYITEGPARVRLTDIGAYSIDLEVYCYVDTADRNEFLAVQKDIIMRILKIVDEAGTALALPSQTLYLSRDLGVNSEKQQAAT